MGQVKENTDFGSKNAVMRKLEACKEILESLEDKDVSKETLKPLKLWNTYRRLVSFVNSNGESQEPPDKTLGDLAKLGGKKLNIKKTKDYDFA